MGFAQFSGPEGDTIKETITCAHCQRIVIVTDAPEVGFCHHCFRPVCPLCGRKDQCDPFEKKLERMRARAEFLRKMNE